MLSIVTNRLSYLVTVTQNLWYRRKSFRNEKPYSF